MTEAAGADPLELVTQLEELTVRVERVAARHAFAAVAGYPEADGRPTGVVHVEGGGFAGVGECVAWTAAEQEQFAERCATRLPPGIHRLGELSRGLRTALVEPYAAAALEAAALDLALRQRETNLFRLAGVAPGPVRFLLSFGTFAHPAAALGEVIAAAPRARVKLDGDPGWSDAELAELGALGAVAVLDLKLRGDGGFAERVHAALPNVLIEDPRLEVGPAAAAPPHPAPGSARSPRLAARVAFDAPVLRAADLQALPLRPAAVNVKPARMGGFLEALRAIAACRRAGVATYVGGMFEVGPGRSQSQVLASLFSPEAWNDVAPIRARPDAPWPASPLELPASFIGLGFDGSGCPGAAAQQLCRA